MESSFEALKGEEDEKNKEEWRFPHPDVVEANSVILAERKKEEAR